MEKGESSIHPTAIVEPGAELGLGVKVGPYALIGSKAIIGDQVTIGSYSQIQGKTTVGRETSIYSHCVLGAHPQDYSWEESNETELTCGTNNTFREYSTVSLGTFKQDGITIIGDHNYFMMNTHIAHDCTVGSYNTIANTTTLGGHVEIGDRSVFGGQIEIHQFCKVGSYCMIAAGAILIQDLPPFLMAHGNHASVIGLNSVGLRRSSFSREERSQIKKLFKILYKSNLPLEKAKHVISSEVEDSPHKKSFLSFIENLSSRGLCR